MLEVVRRLIVVAALLAVLVLPADAVGEDDPIFFAVCAYSHTSMDDPIVYPNQPGAAHAHNFSGAWSTEAFSTWDMLRRSGTTCDMPLDTSAYWTPVLYSKGHPVQVRGTFAYFVEGEASLGRHRVGPYPPGLKIVADMNGHPQNGWHCGDGEPPSKGGTLSRTAIPKCPEGAVGRRLQGRIVFPDCWNGRHLDSANHRSHMAYARRSPNGERRGCPSSHPVQVPMLNLKTVYDTYGNHGPYTLAHGAGPTATTTGPVSTYHADFFNAWDQAELVRLVQRCINATQRKGEPCRGNGTRTLNPNSPNPTLVPCQPPPLPADDCRKPAAPRESPAPPDVTGPELWTRVGQTQRVLRRGGAVAYAHCSEDCVVTAKGRLRIGRRVHRMRPASRSAQAGERVRLKIGLTKRARRVLRRALRARRQPAVYLRLRARDEAGNQSTRVRRRVGVRTNSVRRRVTSRSAALMLCVLPRR
jgi:hypothetical protein